LQIFEFEAICVYPEVECEHNPLNQTVAATTFFSAFMVFSFLLTRTSSFKIIGVRVKCQGWF
jgi:hypothetical protein